MTHNPEGNYRFLPGIEPYSSGVIAEDGYQIIHVTLARLLPYREGFQRIDEYLRERGRGRPALCAVELRSPAAFTRAGFIEFNHGYRGLLADWGLLRDGVNPIARTNVAPLWQAPRTESLFGFSYTEPLERESRPTFVVAGAGELRSGSLEAAAVIRGGETTPAAMQEKAHHVMATMTRRLEGLGVGWPDVTTTDVYTIRSIEAALGPAILEPIGPAASRGIHWYHARPPIDELEFEMDVRGVSQEITL